MSEKRCSRCDGEGRILVVHPDTVLDPAAMEFGRLKVERDPNCQRNVIYDVVCPCSMPPPPRPTPQPEWMRRYDPPPDWRSWARWTL